MYYNQIVHHKPSFNLFTLYCNNLFDNQGSEINKNDIFCTFRHTAFYENFLPTLLYSPSLYIYIIYIMYIIYILLYYIYIIYHLPLLRFNSCPIIY